MEELVKKYGHLENALGTLELAVRQFEDVKKNKKIIEGYSIEETLRTSRDSMIQRFEYTIDTFWKYLKNFLQTNHGMATAIASPKTVIREAGKIRLYPEEIVEQLLFALEQRNLTSHIYLEEIANDISQHIPKLYNAIAISIDKIKP